MDWDLLKRYRVWQANRRQLLYPENYLEPELRDDKEPAFPAKSRFRPRRRPKADGDE